MKVLFKILVLGIMMFNMPLVVAQSVIESYEIAKQDTLKIGSNKEDVLPYIQGGYTIMLPETASVKGVLILLEDSGFDEKNKSAKQLYNEASKNAYAVLSVSTELPFDFYFKESSMQYAHNLISSAFEKYNLPNENIFFLGWSLAGHRALRYVKFVNDANIDFKLNIKGLVLCNFTMDWTRKWHQYQREIRINRNSLWEAKFITYMLETYLGGTPLEAPQNYHDFSAYSYFDTENRTIEHYKNYAIRAYIEPATKYRYSKYLQTNYENSATDMLGFLAELELAGNENTDLVVLPSTEDISVPKNADTTWSAIDKEDLMQWILRQ